MVAGGVGVPGTAGVGLATGPWLGLPAPSPPPTEPGAVGVSPGVSGDPSLLRVAFEPEGCADSKTPFSGSLPVPGTLPGGFVTGGLVAGGLVVPGPFSWGPELQAMTEITAAWRTAPRKMVVLRMIICLSKSCRKGREARATHLPCIVPPASLPP